MQKIVSTLLLCVIASTGFAQHLVNSSSVSAELTTFRERMFVHIDRTDYIAGDILWVKIYNTDANTHRPAPYSKVAYIEVVDRNSNAVLQTKVELTEGKGAGSLFIPVTVPTGNYLVRAYTAWMKNESPDHFFHQAITIVNTQKEYSPDTVAKYKPVISFFPESGVLVSNVEAVVAFRALDTTGRGMQCSGVVLDEANNEVVQFQSAAFGIGRFRFTPSAAHQYHAMVKATDGSQITTPLPAVKQSGYTIHASEQGGKVVLQVIGMPANDKYAQLVVHANDRPVMTFPINLLNGPVAVSLDESKLREGVNTITLFNDEQQAVAERVYFRMPSKQLNVTATVDQPLHAQRERVNIQLAATTSNADLSASVYKVKPGSATAQDIVAGLWMGNELHGIIESPSAYFAADKPSSVQIDNLMLTHGFRLLEASSYSNMSKATLRFAPELEAPILEGTVTNNRTGKPEKDITAYLSITGSTPKFFASSSDSTGNIRFVVKDYYGSGELILQNDYRIDSFYKIEMRSPFADAEKLMLPPFRLNKADEPWYTKAGLAVQVQNAVNADRLRAFASPVLDTMLFYNRPVEKYWLDDYKRFTTMEEVLREYVPGVVVRRRGGKTVIDVVNYSLKTILEDPLLLLDGVPVFNGDQILAYDPLKVRKLEVVNSRYVLGSSVFNGLSSWQTYKGDLDGFAPDPRAVVIDYEGLQLQRQFYSPLYETEAQRNSRIPDYRTLLHWSPFINIPATGTNRFSFYTSDQSGTFVVVVQGMDAEGNTGSATTGFDVK